MGIGGCGGCGGQMMIGRGSRPPGSSITKTPCPQARLVNTRTSARTPHAGRMFEMIRTPRDTIHRSMIDLSFFKDFVRIPSKRIRATCILSDEEPAHISDAPCRAVSIRLTFLMSEKFPTQGEPKKHMFTPSSERALGRKGLSVRMYTPGRGNS